MRKFLHRILLFYMIVTSSSAASTSSSCPGVCVCNYPKKLVDCSNRSLREIPRGVPTWTETLHFRNNKITSEELQSPIFQDLVNLTEIDFSDNENLNEIDFPAPGPRRLQTLRVDRCSLEKFPHAANFPAVSVLSLSENRISKIGRNLKRWRFLRELDLSGNRIRKLGRDTFVGSLVLEKLNLNRNRIGNLQQGCFKGLTNLARLEVSGNAIRHMNLYKNRVNNCNLPGIRYVDLSWNKIRKLDSLFLVGMCKLERLLVNNNKLSILKDGCFYGLSNIKYINMDHNFIEEMVPGWLFITQTEQHLKSISLAHNALRFIGHDAFKMTQEVEYLNVSHNHITTLFDGSLPFFRQLRVLETLDLSFNHIAELKPDSFSGLNNLKNLNLSNNMLICDDDQTGTVFEGMTKLQSIDLSRNHLGSVPPRMFRTKHLHEINLSGNNLTSVGNDTFGENYEVLLNIESHSFICDCKLVYFATFLRRYVPTMTTGDKKNLTHVNASCFHPPQLKGRMVHLLNADYLKCGDQPIPFLNQQPPEVISTHKGDNVTLECSSTATVVEKASADGVQMSVTWWRKDAELRDSGRVRIRSKNHNNSDHVFSTSLLFIHQIEYKDEDEYSCVVMNKFGKTRSRATYLQVVADPVIIHRPSNNEMVSRAGGSVKLGCEATGRPRPHVTWERTDGAFLAVKEKRVNYLQNLQELDNNFDDSSDDTYDGGYDDDDGGGVDYSLNWGLQGDDDDDDDVTTAGVGENDVIEDKIMNIEMIDLKPEDSGEYLCVAKSEFGVDSIAIKLTVQFAPKVEEMKMVTKRLLGSMFRLQCEAVSYPLPTIEWSHEGATLNLSKRHFLTNRDRLLVIVGLQNSDAGSYRCEAKNTLGSRQTQTQLILVEDESQLAGDDVITLFFADLGWGVIISMISLFIIVIVSTVWICVLCRFKKQQDQRQSCSTDTELSRIVDDSHYSTAETAAYPTTATTHLHPTTDHRQLPRGGADDATTENDDGGGELPDSDAVAAASGLSLMEYFRQENRKSLLRHQLPPATAAAIKMRPLRHQRNDVITVHSPASQQQSARVSPTKRRRRKTRTTAVAVTSQSTLGSKKPIMTSSSSSSSLAHDDDSDASDDVMVTSRLLSPSKSSSSSTSSASSQEPASTSPSPPPRPKSSSSRRSSCQDDDDDVTLSHDDIRVEERKSLVTSSSADVS